MKIVTEDSFSSDYDKDVVALPSGCTEDTIPLRMLLKVSFLLILDLRKLSHHLLTMTWPLGSNHHSTS